MFPTILNRFNLRRGKTRSMVAAAVCAAGLGIGLACGVAAALPASLPARGKSSMKNTLLNAVRTLRAVTRSQVKSGYGVAEETTNNIRYGGGNAPLQYAPLYVKFWFSGNECLWKAYSLGKPQKLRSTTLIRNGLVIRYFPGHGHVRRHSFGQFSPNVNIDSAKVDRMSSLTVGRLIFWTYRHITAISPIGEDRHDWKYFPQAHSMYVPFPHAPKPVITVKKSGSLITVEFSWPTDPSTFRNTRTTVFDISAGGMVVRWKAWSDGLDGPQLHHRSRGFDAIRTTWRRAGNCYLPETQTRETHWWLDGKNNRFARTRIRFLKFVVAPVKNSVFRVTNMNILEGATVFDNVHRSQYFYSPAVAARMLGQEKPATTKPASGGH